MDNTDKKAEAIYSLWNAFLSYMNEEPDTHTEYCWGRILLWSFMEQQKHDNVLDFIADFHNRYRRSKKWHDAMENFYRQYMIQTIS